MLLLCLSFYLNVELYSNINICRCTIWQDFKLCQIFNLILFCNKYLKIYKSHRLFAVRFLLFVVRSWFEKLSKPHTRFGLRFWQKTAPPALRTPLVFLMDRVIKQMISKSATNLKKATANVSVFYHSLKYNWQSNIPFYYLWFLDTFWI